MCRLDRRPDQVGADGVVVPIPEGVAVEVRGDPGSVLGAGIAGGVAEVRLDVGRVEALANRGSPIVQKGGREAHCVVSSRLPAPPLATTTASGAEPPNAPTPQ